MKTDIIKIETKDIRRLATKWAISELNAKEIEEIVIKGFSSRMEWIIENWSTKTIEAVITTLSEAERKKIVEEYVAKKVNAIMEVLEYNDQSSLR